jgi:hypothetical protein
MKDHARHVPGSTGSRRRTFVFIRVDSWLAQSTYKTQTKCIQNRNSDFFNYSVSTTYNFNAVTCLNFADPKLNLPPNLNLNQPCARRPGPGRYPFSLGEKVRMRDKLVTLCQDTGCGNKLFNTVQNETKRDGFEHTLKNNRVVPTIYDDSARVRPILQEALMTREFECLGIAGVAHRIPSLNSQPSTNTWRFGISTTARRIQRIVGVPHSCGPNTLTGRRLAQTVAARTQRARWECKVK